MKYIDLFCGIGAFHIALRKLGHKCVMASDIQAKQRAIYLLNHGIEPMGDITKIDADTIPDFDLLCAGFPCQPFTQAGLKLGFDDPRGTLFFEILRIVKAKRPKLVVLENVQHFTTHDSGKTLKVVKTSLENEGYTFQYRIINAAKHRSPQARKRVYMVAIRNDVKSDFDIHRHIPEIYPEVPVREILDPTIKFTSEKMFAKYEFRPTGNSKREFLSLKTHDVVMKLTGKFRSQGQCAHSIDAVGPTITARGGGPAGSTGLFGIGTGFRHLTVHETLKMFGFSPDFQWKSICSDSSMIQHLGNSIVVDVLDDLFKALFSHIDLAANDPTTHDS